jgi:FAD/FMN-containing dehydrogenase
MARGGQDAAFGDRSAQFVVNVIARTPDGEGFDDNVRWARATVDDLAPVSRAGSFVNFMGDAADTRLRASYGDANYDRLVALKRRYDPANLFHLNQNISPQ